MDYILSEETSAVCYSSPKGNWIMYQLCDRIRLSSFSCLKSAFIIVLKRGLGYMPYCMEFGEPHCIPVLEYNHSVCRT